VTSVSVFLCLSEVSSMSVFVCVYEVSGVSVCDVFFSGV